LFYADDGVILARSCDEATRVLAIVEAWTVRMALRLNPKKCVAVSAEDVRNTFLVYGEPVQQEDSVHYLGLPVTANGIDFPTYLNSRFAAAVGRTSWLQAHSDHWGPAHRLRVYRQFVAPMTEYAAPLVWAWAQDNKVAFRAATIRFRELMAWVVGTSATRYNVTANICGILPPEDRFEQLHAAYQFVLA
jgi:hypothetical protein